MSFKFPGLKELTAIVSAGGEGGSGAYGGSDYDATAIRLDGSEGSYKYMKVTHNGRPTDVSSNPGTAVVVPNNIVIKAAKVNFSQFKGYAWGSEQNVGLSYSNSPKFMIGTTWADASAVTSQTASAAGSLLPIVPYFVSSGSLSVIKYIGDYSGHGTDHFSPGYGVVTTGGALSFAYAKGYDSYHSTSSASDNRLSAGIVTLTLYYEDL